MEINSDSNILWDLLEEILKLIYFICQVKSAEVTANYLLQLCTSWVTFFSSNKDQ